MSRRLASIALALVAICAPRAAVAQATPAPSPVPSAATPAVTPLAIARCTWAALPMTTRAALIGSGPTIGDIGQAMGNLSPALMALAQSQCPEPPNQVVAEASKDAWAGVVMTSWAQGELTARYGVASPALLKAWSHVPLATRQQIGAGFDRTPETVRPTVATFAAELHLTDPAAMDLLSAWSIAQLRLSALN